MIQCEVPHVDSLHTSTLTWDKFLHVQPMPFLLGDSRPAILVPWLRSSDHKFVPAPLSSLPPSPYLLPSPSLPRKVGCSIRYIFLPFTHQFRQWRNPIRAVSRFAHICGGRERSFNYTLEYFGCLGTVFLSYFNTPTPTMWQMNTHNPMDRGISYPRCSFPGSVAAKMVKISTNVRRSSIPKAWAPFISSAGLVTPRSPCNRGLVRPYKSAAPKIPGNKNTFISKVELESVIV